MHVTVAEPIKPVGTPAHTTDLIHLVQDLQVEIDQRWGVTDEFLNHICRYALIPNGKLFRPILLLESCMAVGGDPIAVMPAAVGAEYGHVASLIHDDIIDADEMRRGRTSVFHKFGLSNAILSGDALIFHLFLCLAECKTRNISDDRVVEALRVVAMSGVDLCRGQSLEAEICGDLQCSIDTYTLMIKLKTAAFFRGSSECGAVLGGGTPEQVDVMAQYGDHLGIAFQISDDLLGYTSSDQLTGKSAHSDVKNKRLTLPVIYAYNNGSEADRALITAIFNDEYAPDESFQLMQRCLEDSGAIAKAQETALNHAKRAHDVLDILPPSTSRDRMHYYIDLAVNRNM